MNDKNPTFIYILTAGRTGSTYIDKLLSRVYPDLIVMAEREPARIIKAIHNLSLLEIPVVSDFAGNLAREWYSTSRKNFIKRTMGSSHLIEINPFIVGLGAGLATIASGPSVHIVRHPVSWVRSSIGFGSYSWRRPITPYLPLARERLPLSDSRWNTWDEIERFAWRWYFRNSAIESFAKTRDAGNHRIFKYEDFFYNGKSNIDQFRNLSEHIGLDPDKITRDTLIDIVVNPTSEKHLCELTASQESRIFEICGDLPEKYGYTID